MGAWGTGIFADDNAIDLRDDYRKLIGDGVTGPGATEKLIAQCAPQGDSDLAPVFWLALALTRWSCGRLAACVKEEALRVIADGSAIRPWGVVPVNRSGNVANSQSTRQEAVRYIASVGDCDCERT
jgi:hypothetical protein